MKKVKGWLWLILAVICVLVGVWVVQDNPLETSVVLLGFPLFDLPLGIWLLATFFLGSTFSFVVGLPGSLKLKARVRRLHRQVETQKTEIKK